MNRSGWTEEPSSEISDSCERALIGCLLVDPSLVNYATGINSKSFRLADCAAVWNAIAEMTEEKVFINFRTVADWTKGNIGELAAMTDVTQCCGEPDEVREYARIITQAALMRRKIERRGERR